MSDKIVLYDVKLSQDIISDVEKNIITNSLIKNENPNNKKCFLMSFLIISIIIITIGAYFLLT